MPIFWADYGMHTIVRFGGKVLGLWDGAKSKITLSKPFGDSLQRFLDRQQTIVQAQRRAVCGH